MLKEMAVADLDGVYAAIDAGADRIELNDHLEQGGLTPDYKLVAKAVELTAQAKIDLVVMVRPRAGNFCYSHFEVETMLQTILHLRKLGVSKVTFGVLTPNGGIARNYMLKLLEAAGSMEVIFHMAFDDIAHEKQAMAMYWLKEHGVKRILTHGGQLSSPIDKTLDWLKETIASAPLGMTILPGGGVTYENASMIAEKLAVSELHGTRIVKLV